MGAFSGTATAPLSLHTAATGFVQYTGTATSPLSLLTSSAASGPSGSPSQHLNLGSNASGGPSGSVTAPVVLGSQASGSVTGTVNVNLNLGTLGMGMVLSGNGFIPTYVFFYTGTTRGFESDMVQPNTVLFSFLSVGFVITHLQEVASTASTGEDPVYLFTLQRYALPPIQPLLTP